MLILSRRVNEELILHTDEGLKITVVICQFHGGQVRIGIDAPDHVHVDRSEIYDRKMADKGI